METLRKIVEDCYDHHKQPFLLKYSSQLSENEPANLRYTKDTDTTTSLFSRKPKKLLLTFRNENMVSTFVVVLVLCNTCIIKPEK